MQTLLRSVRIILLENIASSKIKNQIYFGLKTMDLDRSIQWMRVGEGVGVGPVFIIHSHPHPPDGHIILFYLLKKHCLI
jgi:hypothetical protein